MKTSLLVLLGLILIFIGRPAVAETPREAYTRENPPEVIFVGGRRSPFLAGFTALDRYDANTVEGMIQGNLTVCADVEYRGDSIYFVHETVRERNRGHPGMRRFCSVFERWYDRRERELARTRN